MKMEYFQNLDVDKVNDNKFFLKTVKARFSNKWKTENKLFWQKGIWSWQMNSFQTLSVTILLTLQKL